MKNWRDFTINILLLNTELVAVVSTLYISHLCILLHYNKWGITVPPLGGTREYNMSHIFLPLATILTNQNHCS